MYKDGAEEDHGGESLDLSGEVCVELADDEVSQIKFVRFDNQEQNWMMNHRIVLPTIQTLQANIGSASRVDIEFSAGCGTSPAILVRQTTTYGWAIKIPAHLYMEDGTEAAGAMTKLMRWITLSTMTTEVKSVSSTFLLSLDTPNDDVNFRPITLMSEPGEMTFFHQNSGVVEWSRVPKGQHTYVYDYVARRLAGDDEEPSSVGCDRSLDLVDPDRGTSSEEEAPALIQADCVTAEQELQKQLDELPQSVTVSLMRVVLSDPDGEVAPDVHIKGAAYSYEFFISRHTGVEELNNSDWDGNGEFSMITEKSRVGKARGVPTVTRESPRATAVRGLSEKLGLEVEPNQLQWVSSSMRMDNGVAYAIHDYGFIATTCAHINCLNETYIPATINGRLHVRLTHDLRLWRSMEWCGAMPSLFETFDVMARVSACIEAMETVQYDWSRTLYHLNPTARQVLLQIESCKEGTAGVLSQPYGNRLRPVCFYSKSWTGSEMSARRADFRCRIRSDGSATGFVQLAVSSDAREGERTPKRDRRHS
jgi:hypothetical protein